METNGNGNTVTATVVSDPIKAQFDAYRATGGLLPFEAWYGANGTANGTANDSATRTRKARKRKARKVARTGNAASKQRMVEKLAAMVGSKARSKARGKHNPSALDMAALSEKHARLSREYLPKVKQAVAAHEGSTVRKDAARMVASYFGKGTVQGMEQPLWRALFESQRQAVAIVWRVPTDDGHKADLDAAVQKMVRLRADGYKLLGIAPPESEKRDPEPLVKRAMDSARKFLKEMTAEERGQFAKELVQAVRTYGQETPPSKARTTPSDKRATRKRGKRGK